MINEKDIEIYLRAKKDQIARKHLSRLMLVCALVCFGLFIDGVWSYHPLISMSAFVAIFALCNADSILKPTVHRNELIRIIEDQINADSKAIQYISNQKTLSSKNSSRA